MSCYVNGVMSCYVNGVAVLDDAGTGHAVMIGYSLRARIGY